MDPQQNPLSAPREAVFSCYPVEVSRRVDEIGLIDLWSALVRRKAVVLTVAAIAIATGLTFVVLRSPEYRYSALIELASLPTDSGKRLVEGPQTALSKVTEAFMPAVLDEYMKGQPDGADPPKIRASIPKGSETIVLETEGSVDEGPALMRLQQAVVDRLSQDHADFIGTERRAIGVTITTARHALEKLSVNGQMLAAELKRAEELAVTLQQAKDQVQQDLQDATALEQRLLDAKGDQRDMAALLQANVESRALQSERLALEERISIELPKKRDEIRAAIEANENDVAEQQERISALESRLAGLRETHAIQPPMRSLEEIGPGATTVMLLASVLGLLLGFLSALGAEFAAATRKGSANSVADSKI